MKSDLLTKLYNVDIYVGSDTTNPYANVRIASAQRVLDKLIQMEETNQTLRFLACELDVEEEELRRILNEEV